MENQIPVIGRSQPRFDAKAKVSGTERYAADYYPPGMLWGAVKYSDHAHARLKKVDTSGAKEVPGVVAVLTCEDVAGANRVGIPPRPDQPVLADEKVRHRGDPVALVLAESKEALAAALDLIRIDYEVLPAVFDSQEALMPGAPLVHSENENNILHKGKILKGSAKEALKECAAVVEATFRLPRQEHAYLETEAGVAWVEEDGTLVMIVSTQTPHRDRMEVAHALGLPPGRVRIMAPYLGGGFGGKDGISVQCFLGLGALHSGGRPVKIWNSREDSFLSSTKRHPATVTIKLGCGADGALQALCCRLFLDTGAYASLGGPVLTLALEHAGGVYRIPHVDIEGYCVYTNNPVSGAFRGFGATQALAALEQAVDMLAVKAGLDPLVFRLKNALRRGEESACGPLRTYSTGIASCLKTIMDHPLWLEARSWEKDAPPFKRRGVGVAAVLQGVGYGPVVPDYANAKIELLEDGRIRVYSGVTDMGQGNASTYLQIAGDILSQRFGDMEAVQPDTARTLPSGSSSASRTTFTYGNALIKAAGLLRERILQRASLMLMGAAYTELALLPGRVRHIPSGRDLPLGLIASMLDSSEKVCVYSYVAPVARDIAGIDENFRNMGYPHLIFSYGAHLARIEIDEITGEVTVKSYLACTDAGRVLNPQAYEQQVHGGIVQSLGYTLFEDFQVQKGEILTTGLATYILPTAVDVPDLLSIAVQEEEENGPYGMKGLGEVCANATFPAVANAAARAAGRRIFEGPLTAERILEVLAEEHKGE